MIDFISTAIEFLFVTIIFKVIIVRWLAEQLLKIFKKFFVKTNRDIAIWIHYYNRALNKGHQHKTPVICDEGGCSLV